MEFLIITGMSGAGKSRAADVLEDLDFYCVDNMPVALIPRFAELCMDTRGRYEKVALVTDVREKDGIPALLQIKEELAPMDCQVRILYMDADTRTLVRRYKESRRPHPLMTRGVTLEQAVQREEELLREVKAQADFVVDSSRLTLGMLQNHLFSLFADGGKKRDINVTVMSFGFKHGIPMEADLVFDARCQQTRTFMEKIQDLIDFLLPLYIEEGKLGLTIAIGCTGGRHRSVAIANALNDYFTAKGISSENINRDINK